MIGLTLLLASTFLITAFAPRSALGALLRRVLVDRPAELLNGGPLRIFVALIVLAGLVAFAVGAPELVAMIGMADLSIYLDLAVVAFLLSAAGSLKAAAGRVAVTTRRVVRLAARAARRLRVRARRPRTPSRGAPSDDGWPASAWALA